jgi:UDP-glucuronate decarboxylase
MRILATGGAGFTGSHLCERLLEEVFCMDNYYTGTKENIAGLLSDPGFKPA